MSTDTNAPANSNHTAPRYLPICLESLPLADLAPYSHWVTWAPEWREGRNGNPGAWTKVPKDPRTGRNAKSSDPTTWASLNDVLSRFERIGFVVAEDDPFAFIDLDTAIDPDTNQPKQWAQAIIDRFPTYWERSPSGTGLKGLIRARPLRNRIIRIGDGQVEIFFTGKYTTLTGHRIAGAPANIHTCQTDLDAFLGDHGETAPALEPRPRPAAPLFLRDDEVIERARAARNSAKFERLFDRGDAAEYDHDHSRADQALVSLLSFWSTDTAQIDRIFRRSALSRGKWTDRADYRQRTTAKALARGAVYAPSPSTPLAGLRTRHVPLRVREAHHA